MAKKKSRKPSRNAGNGAENPLDSVGGAEINDDRINDDLGVRLDIEPYRKGLVRVIRRGLDLSNYYIYLDAITLRGDPSPLVLKDFRTSEMTEYWEEMEPGHFSVWVSDEIVIHPMTGVGDSNRAMRQSDRTRLLAAVGSQCDALLAFRIDGDSPELVVGKDVVWVEQCVLTIRSAELGDYW